MRIGFVPATLGIFACLASNLVHAETAAICLENALPLEILRNDADQREAFFLQAKACMRWLRKAILRAAGVIPLHDEAIAFATETEELRDQARQHVPSR